VVVGEAVQHTTTQQVGARVTDVQHAELGAGEQGATDGGPHPVERRIGLHQVCQCVVGAAQRTGQQLVGVLDGVGAVGLEDFPDGDGGGQVTGGGTAHPVGDDEHGGRGVPGVLVVAAHQANLGMGAEVEREGHVRAPA